MKRPGQSGTKTYEIQVFQSGRWMIHAQYPASQKEDAIDEAKSLQEIRGFGDIKVVSDVYNSRTGESHEQVVYKHTRMMTGGSSSDLWGGPSLGAPRGAGTPQNWKSRSTASDVDLDLGLSPSGRANKNGKKRSPGFFTKLVLVTLFSMVVAALITIIAGEMLPAEKIFGIAFYGQTRSNALLGFFIIFFLFTLLSSAVAFISKDDLKTPRARKKKVKKPLYEVAQTDDDQDEAQGEVEDVPQTEEEVDAEAESEEPEAEEDAEPEPEPEPEPEKDPVLTPFVEKQKAQMMTFFGQALGTLTAAQKKMDTYNKFGVNLYLAGASETLGSERGLEPAATAHILRESVQIMGFKKENAETFSERYHDYLLQDSRYMQMFQSGRLDMNQYLGAPGDGKPTDGEQTGLSNALLAWNKPKEPDDPEREVTVMFTDLVGSTAMTHEKGNKGAQEIVRAHNTIVRDILSRTGGHEVKHTGDGIMASFENVQKSVFATAEIQRQVALHNQTNTDTPLKIKIGVNVGRALAEENDLYGVTVQLAARIVDKAQADQILVSETVYGMSKGGDIQFIKRGPYLMKGIDGPAYLYEVVWDGRTDISALQKEASAENTRLARAAGLPEASPGAIATQPSPTPGDAASDDTATDGATQTRVPSSPAASPAKAPTNA